MNPKLANSGIIDCVPQTGKCPLNCEDCFFNLHFDSYELPIWPDPIEVNKAGLIVRVNSVHDSSLIKESEDWLRIKQYNNKFYNTRMVPRKLAYPSVLTWSTEISLDTFPIDQIMFIRLMVTRGHFNPTYIKTNRLSKIIMLQDVLNAMNIPTVATFMRYSTKPPGEFEQFYEAKMHFKHSYWIPKAEAVNELMRNFNKTGLLTCGRSYSGYCVDCGNCESLYWRWVRLYG